MKTLLFDLETDGLLDSMSKLHCVAAMWSTEAEPTLYDSQTGFEPFLSMIGEADRIVAHNLFGFDLPALQQLFPFIEIEASKLDTLVMCRALWNDISKSDYSRVAKEVLPKKLVGSHSLEAYGYRLNILKGDYGKQENAWDTYTPEMGEYCVQDVVVLKALFDKIMNEGPTPEFIELENEFAEIVAEQERTGVYFNVDGAKELEKVLRDRKEELEKELQEAFPPRYLPVEGGKTFTARCKSKFLPGIYKGVDYCKIELDVFNPGSRQQIAKRLIEKYFWRPTEKTEKGSIKVSEEVLNTLEYPEAKLLAEYMMLIKRLGQIADGKAAWLKLVKGNRIHGRVNTGGAVTGRCTHSTPNLAQVPAVRAPYGEECRSLFTVPKGYKLVGCDASGLELRCLAHYLANYDGGEYADIVLNGDIHTANQEAAGLPTRDMAKTFIYGLIYGAGPAKIGSIIDGSAKEGQNLQRKFMRKYPAVKQLRAAVERVIKTRKYIKGLDGRKMRIRSEHAALNMLLQSAGALIMKRWLIEVMRRVKASGLDARPVLNIHDEAQFEVREDQAELLANLCEKMMPLAGRYFNFNIRIDGEAKIGDNWKETH